MKLAFQVERRTAWMLMALLVSVASVSTFVGDARPVVARKANAAPKGGQVAPALEQAEAPNIAGGRVIEIVRHEIAPPKGGPGSVNT